MEFNRKAYLKNQCRYRWDSNIYEFYLDKILHTEEIIFLSRFFFIKNLLNFPDFPYKLFCTFKKEWKL